jgi:hypothetical protein
MFWNLKNRYYNIYDYDQGALSFFTTDFLGMIILYYRGLIIYRGLKTQTITLGNVVKLFIHLRRRIGCGLKKV